MINKNPMICDIETGICGPTDGASAFIELIDLTAPNSDVKEDVSEEK